MEKLRSGFCKTLDLSSQLIYRLGCNLIGLSNKIDGFGNWIKRSSKALYLFTEKGKIYCYYNFGGSGERLIELDLTRENNKKFFDELCSRATDVISSLDLIEGLSLSCGKRPSFEEIIKANKELVGNAATGKQKAYAIFLLWRHFIDDGLGIINPLTMERFSAKDSAPF